MLKLTAQQPDQQKPPTPETPVRQRHQLGAPGKKS